MDNFFYYSLILSSSYFVFTQSNEDKPVFTLKPEDFEPFKVGFEIDFFLLNQNTGSILIKGDHIIFTELYSAAACVVFVDKPRFKSLRASLSNITSYKSVIVYATNTVSINIDADFRFVKHIIVFAPTWNITGKIQISVDGYKGERIISPNKDKFSGLEDVIKAFFSSLSFQTSSVKPIECKPDVFGRDGKPGLPGGPGKMFFGVYKNLIGNGSLTITANGGEGGEGEDGTCGSNSNRGNGGNGGNGGRGGKGGLPGKITLIELNDPSRLITIEKNKGEDGKNGTGGKGGKRGYLEGNQPGKNGTDGKNVKNIEEPKAIDFSIEPFYKYINKYKIYIREQLDYTAEKQYLQNFLHQMDRNTKISSLYNVSGFFEDFQSLVEYCHSLKFHIDCVPFYESLSSRILEYAEIFKNTTNFNQDKKVLIYLYTATINIIYNLKDHSMSNLVVDIGKFLNSTKQELDVLKNLIQEQEKLSNQLYKLKTINMYKELYQNNIKKKIEEAKYFIEKEVLPEIDSIINDLDNKINLLINEVHELQKQAKIDEQRLCDYKKNLQKAMALRGVFSFFKAFSLVASCFGPIGQIVGIVTGTVTGIAESLTIGRKDREPQVLQLPQSVASLENQIRSIRDQKVAQLDLLLEETIQKANKCPESLRDLSVNSTEIRKELKKVTDVKGEKKIRSEFKRTLERKLNSLKMQKLTTTQKTAKAIKVIEKIKPLLEVSEGVVDIYLQHKNNEKEVDVIDEAIRQSQENYIKLNEYEENIYNVLSPTLKSMMNGIKDVNSKLDNKSLVALDVTKWKVQSALRDAKTWIQEMTKGFQVEDSLAHCIEKQQHVMTLLINLYDRIENYKGQQDIGNYIADITSAAVHDIDVSDYSKKVINTIETTIKSNIVLQQYQTAVDAFKQFVFPYAHHYFKGFTLPSHLQTNEILKELIPHVSKQIDHLTNKLSNYQQTVQARDGCIGSGYFNSLYVSTKPFFVWKNQHYKKMISKLLSGQTVVVKSDIMKSGLLENAVKFKLIEFELKSKIASRQTNINNILKLFRISVTHLGDSHYRYNGQIYLINTDSQMFWYNFEKDGNGNPMHKAEAYEKIKSGDFLLSPYAMWKIQLTNVTDKGSFGDLGIYKDEIDLELTGFGYYVISECIGGLDLMVDKYYKPMDIYGQKDLNTTFKKENSILNNILPGKFFRRKR